MTKYPNKYDGHVHQWRVCKTGMFCIICDTHISNSVPAGLTTAKALNRCRPHKFRKRIVLRSGVCVDGEPES